MDQSNNYTAELGGNRTLAVSNVDAGQKFTIRLTQDATGSREPTWWSGITWLTSDGSEPTLKTGSGEIDYFGFISTSGGYYEGFHLTEAGGGGGGGSSTITVKEADGTPNVSNVSTIVVSNGLEQTLLVALLYLDILSLGWIQTLPILSQYLV